MRHGVAHVTTFLYTDLAGSSTVLSQLDEARSASVRRVYFRILRTAIVATGGRELTSHPDGVLAAFRAASDAVECGVAVQRAVRRHNTQGEDRVSVRIGITVGESTDAEETSVEGKIVGQGLQAKALCEAAGANQILVSRLVQALAEERSPHAFAPVGLLELDGQAVSAFEALSDTPAHEPIPLPPELAAAPSGGSPFVGREAELDTLRRLWRDVSHSHRQLALVAGEPGIGKTRLTSEFALEVHEEGGHVLWGRCFEEALVSYQPFVQALRHYVLHADAAELGVQLGAGGAVLARLVPELEPRYAPPVPSFQPDPGGERYRLLDAVTSLLGDISLEIPLLLVVDDLQWADEGTLLLLRSVAIDPRPSSLLVLGTYRDSEVARSHPLARILADIERDRPFAQIDLGGLDEREVGLLVEELTGWHPPPSLTHDLRTESGGSPFFLQELVHQLEEHGASSDPESLATAGRSLAGLTVPRRAKDLVVRRLQDLSPDALEGIRTASVIGTEFELDVLGTILECDCDLLVQQLDEAVERRILVESHDRVGRYGFSHALVQHALYEDVTANRRASLHARIASSLETLHAGDTQSVLPELAHHYASSGTALTGGKWAEKLIEYGRRAGEQSLVGLAYENAAFEFERALQAVRAMTTVDRRAEAELLVLLGTALQRAGDREPTRRTYEEAARIAIDLEDGHTLALAALGFGGGAGFGGTWQTLGVVDELLVEFLETALALLPTDDDALRVRVLGRLAQALYWSPSDRARMLALSSEALRAARSLGDPAAIGYALDSRHVALWGPDDLDERLRIASEMLELGIQAADPDLELEAYAWLITDALESGWIDVVDKYMDAHARLAEELRQPYHLWYTETTRAMRAQLEGTFADAATHIERAWQYGERAHPENAVQTNLAQTFFLRLELGDLVDVVESVEAYTATTPLRGWQAALALAYAGLDRPEQALAELASFATDGFESISRDCLWSCTLACLVRVAARFDDERSCAELYRLLLPYANRTAVTGGAVATLGPISRLLGMAARGSGNPDRALVHLEDAFRASEMLRSPPLVTRTQLEMARAFVSRRAPGDAHRALELLERVESEAVALGMQNVARDASRLRDRVALVPAATAT